ncbi:hypothetical protein P8452_19429 [Trifolium repens]|nr:hypothetical protein P8452_19429 [Trifolium repens]
MDDYYCKAWLCFSDSNPQTISCDANYKYFNIQFDYKTMFVPTDHTMLQSSFGDIQRHTLRNVSMDRIMDENTFVSWFSQINIPQDAFTLVQEEIMCAADIVHDETYKNRKFFTIRVEFSVTRTIEVVDCEDEEDNGLIPDVIEIESDEGDYDLEEDEDLMMIEEEHTRFIPAAKSCLEELKMVKAEEITKCTICFEDVNVGVPLPCSHMFHMNCIQDWLVIGHCCPLCRFQLPMSE